MNVEFMELVKHPLAHIGIKICDHLLFTGSELERLGQFGTQRSKNEEIRTIGGRENVSSDFRFGVSRSAMTVGIRRACVWSHGGKWKKAASG